MRQGAAASGQTAGGSSRSVAYNEYKYCVPPANVHAVRSLLDSLAGRTDPYPEGHVQSIYSDTPDMRMLDQCARGGRRKVKFRVRRYDGLDEAELQVKRRILYGVSKLKSGIAFDDAHYARWPTAPGRGTDGRSIQARAARFIGLRPIVDIHYHRRRYRFLDYRVTLDTEIRASACGGLRGALSGEASVRYGVLEVKAVAAAPVLPPVLRRFVRHQGLSKYATMTRRLLGRPSW